MSRSSTFAFATSIAIVMITIHVYGTSEASGPIATSEYDVAINLTIETDRRRESTPFNATERIVRVTALVGRFVVCVVTVAWGFILAKQPIRPRFMRLEF
jgi:hypothetical protein